ncbi:hypothetical protein B4Q13_15555, partial [Lacticaseibacillus rhamnosus]
MQVDALAKGYQAPHFVEPKPSFILLVNRADLLVVVGRELYLAVETQDTFARLLAGSIALGSRQSRTTRGDGHHRPLRIMREMVRPRGIEPLNFGCEGRRDAVRQAGCCAAARAARRSGGSSGRAGAWWGWGFRGARRCCRGRCRERGGEGYRAAGGGGRGGAWRGGQSVRSGE